MGVELCLPVGIVCIDEYVVDREHLAKHVSDDYTGALSTPSMIAFMERTSMMCVQKHLPIGYTTVGVLVNVKHLNPAPLGAKIKVEAKLIKQEGRKLVFEVKALLGGIIVGEGIHERFIVSKDRFLERIRKVFEHMVTR